MLAGVVVVDGEVVTRLGTKVDPRTAVIRVDGKRLPPVSAHVYLALNKPRGVVSTMSDPEGRRTLQDLVDDRPERLFHVGRLDTDTDGLILLTNDGDFAQRLAHPSYEVDKTYVAEVDGRLTQGRPAPADRRRDPGRRPGDGLVGPAGVGAGASARSSSWSSTRAATGSSAGCSTTSATPSAASPGPRSARSSSRASVRASCATSPSTSSASCSTTLRCSRRDSPVRFRGARGSSATEPDWTIAKTPCPYLPRRGAMGRPRSRTTGEVDASCFHVPSRLPDQGCEGCARSPWGSWRMLTPARRP